MTIRVQHWLLSCFVLLAVSCGPQHEAETVVRDFMEENIKDDISLQIIDFGKIDSTRHINDSIIRALRDTTTQSGLYRKDINYSDAGNGGNLLIIRVKYKVNGTEQNSTFYLDDSSYEVVAIK